MTKKTTCCDQMCNQGRDCSLRILRAKPVRGGTQATMDQRRTDACARILVLMQAGPVTSADVAADLKVSNITGYRYLAYMRDTLRNIHNERTSNRRDMHLWVLGEDAEIASSDELLDRSFAPKRYISPARQIGMIRDSLIAAFFGPAGENRA